MRYPAIPLSLSVGKTCRPVVLFVKQCACADSHANDGKMLFHSSLPHSNLGMSCLFSWLLIAVTKEVISFVMVDKSNGVVMFPRVGAVPKFDESQYKSSRVVSVTAPTTNWFRLTVDIAATVPVDGPVKVIAVPDSAFFRELASWNVPVATFVT